MFRFAEEWRVYEGKEDEGEGVKVENPGRVINYDFVSSKGAMVMEDQ